MLTTHVEPAVGVDGLADDGLAGLEVGHVVAVDHRLAAGRRDLVDDLLGRRLVRAGAVDGRAQVIDHDLGPLGGQQPGHAGPDAAAGPGDDRYPSLEQSSHELSCSSAARGPESRQGGALAGVVEGDLDGVADLQRVDVAVDDVGHDPRPLGQLDVGQHVGRDVRYAQAPRRVTAKV